MVLPLMQGAQMGLDLIGSQGMAEAANAQNEYQWRVNKDIFKYLQGLEAPQEEGFAEQRDVYQQLLDTLSGGTQAAQAQVANVGSASARRIMDREQQARGSSQQNLANYGLSGTTFRDASERGVRYGTEQSLGDLSEGLAGLHAGITQRGAEAQAGGLAGLSGLLGQQTGARTNLGLNLASYAGSERRPDEMQTPYGAIGDAAMGGLKAISGYSGVKKIAGLF